MVVVPEADVQGNPHRVAGHEQPVSSEEEPGRRIHDHEAHHCQEEERGCDAVLQIPHDHPQRVLVFLDLLFVFLNRIFRRQPPVAQTGHGVRDPPDATLQHLEVAFLSVSQCCL